MIDTTPNLVLVATIVVMVTVGVYLLLERSLTRVLIGVVVLSNAVNLLFLIAGGAAGGPPIIGQTPVDEMSDPLPQAMVLTAIVITLGLTAFLLAMAYRSWQLNQHDEVQDDLEDRRVARRALADEAAFDDADTDVTSTWDEEAAQIRDETDDDAAHGRADHAPADRRGRPDHGDGSGTRPDRAHDADHPGGGAR